MIVRDAERTLEPCLASIQPWVDEIVVVDTGSVDQTTEIAKRYGARLFHFTWCDDFSSARNESFRHASGEWVFWMDADDTIDAINGHKLRQLVDQEHDESVLGYVMQVHCPAQDGGLDYTAVDHVKLIRNRPNLRFEGRIHEQILPAIRDAGGETKWTDIFVTHSGSDQSPEGRHRKHQRDLRILHLDHQERPDHPFVLFNLGMTYADMGRYEDAVKWLEQSIARALPTESHLRKAYALLASCFYYLERKAEAEDACKRGLTLFGSDPELWFRQAMLAHDAGQLAVAVDAYRRTLNSSTERYFASLDTGVVGAKARHNLGCVFADMDRHDLAEVHWRHAVNTGGAAISRQLLIGALITQKRFAAAELELARFEQDPSNACQTLLLRSQFNNAQGHHSAAQELLEQATNLFASEPSAWEALARFHFEQNNFSRALEPLTKLVELDPDNAAALHNLGMIRLRIGEVTDAQAALEKSLRLRPDSPGTVIALKEAAATSNAARLSEQR